MEIPTKPQGPEWHCRAEKSDSVRVLVRSIDTSSADAIEALLDALLVSVGADSMATMFTVIADLLKMYKFGRSDCVGRPESCYEPAC